LITIEREDASSAQVRLYNALGMKIWERSPTAQRSILPLDVSKGVYFLSVGNERGERFEKVVVR
jgi:hypothetical protein